MLISPIPPFLLQAGDNPDGLPGSVFDGFIQAARADTPAWMKGFLDNFYNIDVFGGTRVSDQAFQASWNVAAAASATAAMACIGTWQTDFREDLPKIDVLVLVVQGDADRILPYPNTGKRLPGLIKDMDLAHDPIRARPGLPADHRTAMHNGGYTWPGSKDCCLAGRSQFGSHSSTSRAVHVWPWVASDQRR